MNSEILSWACYSSNPEQKHFRCIVLSLKVTELLPVIIEYTAFILEIYEKLRIEEVVFYRYCLSTDGALNVPPSLHNDPCNEQSEMVPDDTSSNPCKSAYAPAPAYPPSTLPPAREGNIHSTIGHKLQQQQQLQYGVFLSDDVMQGKNDEEGVLLPGS